jgi:hypothetical protein
MTIHKQQKRMTDSTNPVETSMVMQPSSLPTRPYTSRRCYITNSCVGKSVHLLLGQTTYIIYIYTYIYAFPDYCIRLSRFWLYTVSHDETISE